jgi:two-component system, chemotaxis family, sensor histidine kinase and response regulator PixL
MITSDQEQQVKLQFLDEATDYLDTIESGLLGLGTGAVSTKQIDALMRAAHSIKGGAGMMGYTTLAKLGHPLEDYFKIIQYGKSAKADSEVEQLLLGTVDKLRSIVKLNRQGQDADATWLAQEVQPLFDRLREKLGEFNPEDEANMLASESGGEDILTFLFESEVERCLESLETIVDSGDTTSLYDELIVSTEELGGLAEMVELPAMASLCQSVLVHLEAVPHRVREITALALAEWRRTQAMVLIGQTANLPREIELPGSGIVSIGSTDRAEWSQIDLNDIPVESVPMALSDFTLDPPLTLADLDTLAETLPEDAISIEWPASDIDLNTLADPFASFSLDPVQPFSTITATDDLSEADPQPEDLHSAQTMVPSEGDDERIHFATTIANETLSAEDFHFATTLADDGTQIDATLDDLHSAPTMVPSEGDDERIHFATTIANETLSAEDFHFATTIANQGTQIDEDEIDAFSMLDLSGDLSMDEETFDRLDFSGDLSLDTDASEFFAAIAELPADMETPSSVFKLNPSAKPKDDYLDREAAELLAALNAAPEVPGEALIGDDEPTANPAQAATQADQTIRVATKQLEQIGDLFGELTIDRNGLNLQLQGLRQLVASLRSKIQQLEQSNSKLRAAYDSAASEGQAAPIDTWTPSVATLTSDITDRLDLLEFDRYSDLHLLSQEVMDNIVQIEEITTDIDLQLNDTERTTRDLNRTANQLQTGLTQVRMRPISELFNRFPRAIRNMSIQHSKPVDLKLKGGNTLLERSVLEALNDPLMHLLRNGFDHGIEPSAVRRANGKPDAGTIELSAAYRGNQTVITIKDDGGGIDLDKIRAKVKKMGLDEKEIATWSDNDLVNLIFEPGFSTAEKVTDLSGRGVGMDVVRTNIREQHGDISVDTKLGKGTTFTISVPFTLSVVRVLLVEVNGLWLAIPSNIVEEIILLDPAQIVSTNGQKMLEWEGFTVRLVQPKQHLLLPYSSSPPATNDVPKIDCPTVLMIDRGDDLVAIEIDKFWGEQEVTTRQPQGNIQMPPGFAGCTILGDGRVVPLLDAIEFLRWIDGESVQKSVKSNGKLSATVIDDDSSNLIPDRPAQVQRPRILIVDDSINVRRFVALTLEKAGYQVEQAKDGQEAVEKLQAGLVAQAVVCDIEMPRMDGYGFLATIKGQSQFKNLPVLMLTSRSGDKHRKIAMNLGATGYFSKPFKEQELLATLAEVVK